ncbi:hypothetical protein [Actinomadura terrae]|uniref:hypothetical protein n=1 Tax=Actinomadura terrae TaxID=604353 RepID=UPI001FA6ED74|nr:hypothetical protein [Actinomadura terrae]
MKRRVSIVVGGLASAAVLSLAPNAQAAPAPHAHPHAAPPAPGHPGGSGNVGNNGGNSNLTVPVNLGVCGNNIPVLAIPVPILNGGNQDVGENCASQGGVR